MLAWLGPCWASGTPFGLVGEDLEVEFLVDLGELTASCHGEQLIGHGGEDAEVSGSVFGERGHDLGGHELGLSGLLEDMP